METTYYALATKSNFNMSLRHFYKVNEVVDEIERKRNLADVINVQLASDEMVKDQVLPIVGAVVRDKYGYSFDSYNIPDTLKEFDKIVNETAKWTAVDILMVYDDPNGGIVLINPKNSSHWERVRELYRDQLIVVYTKYLKESENQKKLEKEAIAALEEMIAGKDVFINPEFVDQTVTPQAAAPKPVVSPAAAAAAAEVASKKNKTPKYSIQVSNELFHNGNVEAWKKIIESYTTKFTDLDVVIFYEGEVINDINTLFKWGKVKHGSLIFFQVVGEDIRGVSKLQKYLYEGASPRFEQFLKIGVGRVLNLF
ncbi:MAG TPA: hypothetical protein PK200_16370 [Spirochaetota bacterium]|nr:hypothetical protein [Spirochaetota bacterium]HQO01288.1 hypothetical protein [Spirochaetota bacterium]HQP47374.1 hypothetical protein [Spirochaetota bacterium]